MPTVGRGKNKRVFPYTAKGEAAAKKEAKATGKPMETGPHRDMPGGPMHTEMPSKPAMPMKKAGASKPTKHGGKSKKGGY